MVVKYPCGICKKAVANSHRAIQCDICQCWVHIRCNNITATAYNQTINSNESWYCLKCLNDTFPYASLNQESLFLTMKSLKLPLDSTIRVFPASENANLFQSLSNKDFSTDFEYLDIEALNQTKNSLGYNLS